MISYLQVEGISKRFGELMMFENISFSIGKGQKVALIARNGTGKSTMLEIIAKREMADSGAVIYRNDLSIGYLEQDPQLSPDNTLIEELFASNSPILNIIKAYEKAVEKNDVAALEKLIPEMDQHAAWDYESSIKQILSFLKIDMFDQKIRQLSGGQKKRAGLAKVLIQNPDFLILDEPTNHLDVEMTEWLEEYLQKSNVTLLMVTHDRYFLDRVCSKIIELDDNSIYNYDGNYSYYLEKRAERIQVQNATIDKARNLLRTEQEWMRRMPQARSHKAQYRIDNFYQLKDTAAKRSEDKTLQLEIKGQRLGRKILDFENITKSFNGRTLIKDFSYKFIRGEKIGIIGKNGAGKSTLLNILTQNLEPDKGSIEMGETVVYGYYKQSGMEFKNDDRVIDTVKNIAEHIDMGNGRIFSASQLLEYFLFDSKQQYAPVYKLSGGEKRRLYLLTILMKNPNFLILDEPTNDLDIVTLNVLEEYLQGFQGCLLVVSHDRFFTDKIVNHIFAFEGDGIIKDFPGNYTEYRNYKEEQEEMATLEASEKVKKDTVKIKPTNDAPKKRKITFKEQQEFKTLESELETLNNEKAEIENLLNSGTLSTNDLIAKSNRIAELIDIIDEKEMRWLELSEIAES